MGWQKKLQVHAGRVGSIYWPGRGPEIDGDSESRSVTATKECHGMLGNERQDLD